MGDWSGYPLDCYDYSRHFTVDILKTGKRRSIGSISSHPKIEDGTDLRILPLLGDNRNLSYIALKGEKNIING